jgi:hypothetical protein
MIQQKLEAIQKMADQYSAIEFRKDYHIGMLMGLAREQAYEIESLKEEIKTLQLELMMKEQS